jgi:hypothetical protein
MFQNNDGILCDTFVDRTFLWGEYPLLQHGIIPYTSLWIGFVHHTPHKKYTDHNCYRLIKSKSFKQSLPTCRGLVCLSNHLAHWFRKHLSIPIITLYHPTLFVPLYHQPQYFKIKLIQIGAWYRNPFSIYTLKVPHYVDKMALKGPKMNAYFPPDTFTLTTQDIKHPPKQNKWLYYLCRYLHQQQIKTCTSQDIKQLMSTVTIIHQVDNQHYDQLLADSIVFLHLVDASAVNTVIECIVRNTPVIVNRLPALEEYLGHDYPLFYHQLDDVYDMLNEQKLLQGYHYLKQKNKDFLRIETFLSQFNENFKHITK